VGVIVTLLPHAVHRQRLLTAVRDRHELVACEDWTDVLQLCGEQPVRVVVADLFAAGAGTFERLRQMKQRFPRVALIGYVSARLDQIHEIFDAGRLGVDALVLADQDDAPRPLLALIEQAESRSLASGLRQSLDGVDATVRDALLLAVTRAHQSLTTAALVRLLALSRRAVSQRLKAAGFPPPHQLLTWGRLIVAAHMLEEPHRSADRIAIALHFPSGSAFRNTCQRYLHATPGDIRRQGGAAFVVRSLQAQAMRELAALRAITGERGDSAEGWTHPVAFFERLWAKREAASGATQPRRLGPGGESEAE
jgi:AraC-like DNA-binding protein